jgi:hypothetical protein
MSLEKSGKQICEELPQGKETSPVAVVVQRRDNRCYL